MSKSCAACKHWGEPRTEYDDDNIDKIVVGTERRCLRVRRLNQDGVVAPCGAYVIDASGYKAELWTFPDFGCSLHEESERAT